MDVNNGNRDAKRIWSSHKILMLDQKKLRLSRTSEEIKTGRDGERKQLKEQVSIAISTAFKRINQLFRCIRV